MDGARGRREEKKTRHQSKIENNLLRSEMRQLRGKDQKEKKKKRRSQLSRNRIHDCNLD